MFEMVAIAAKFALETLQVIIHRRNEAEMWRMINKRAFRSNTRSSAKISHNMTR